MLGTILIVVLVLLLVGAFYKPSGVYWHNYGYWPGGLVGLILLVVIVLVLLGHI